MIKINFVSHSKNEQKEKLIDLLLMLGGRLHFFDDYFVLEERGEVITGIYLENPDSTEISCWIRKRTTHSKIRKEQINFGWNYIMYEKLYEHSLKEYKKIYEIGSWCV